MRTTDYQLVFNSQSQSGTSLAKPVLADAL